MKKYKITVNGNPFDVTVDSIDENGVAKVSVNGSDYHLEINNNNIQHTVATPVTAPVSAPVSAVKTSSAAVAAPAPATSGAGTAITAPLPGVIISVNVNVGDSVKAGQSVATLEAMKMENAIEAESDGVVKAIHVQKGDSVLEGAIIVTLG